MDDSDQQRKQHEIPGYSTILPLGTGGEGRATQTRVPGFERSRQASLLTGHGPASNTSAMHGGPASGYGYYDEAAQPGSLPVPAAPLQYATEYSQEPQRHASYPGYGGGLMYGVAQQIPQNQPYDPVQPYQQQRRSATLDVLSTQFPGVSPFYVSGEPGGASGASVQSQPAPSQFPSLSFPQQSPAPRPSLATVYTPSMGDVQHSVGDQSMTGQDYVQGPSNYDAAYNQYQTALKRTFANIHNGQLMEAAQTLLEISDWLLTHAVELGLIRDEEGLHADRLKLWTEFNIAWLSTFQKQKEMTQDLLSSGQRPAPPRSMIREEYLEKMGRELVGLCDGMERHGLVDYEMGVWEEEIISILEDCLSLLDAVNSGGGPQAGQPTA